MRILFVSGTSTGGSAVSTRQLAARLARRGNDVECLMRVRTRPRRYELDSGPAVALAKRLTRVPIRAWHVVQRWLSRRPRPAGGVSGCALWTTRFAESSLPALCRRFRPDVVVVNTVHRRAWQSMRTRLRRLGITSVLYLREAGALDHLSISAAPPDLLVSNSHSHTQVAAQLDFSAVTVPSVVEFEDCRVDSTREKVLFVNPIPSRGLDTLQALAQRRPDVPFVVLESSPLHHRDVQAIRRRVGALGNVELRRFEPPAAVYRDARVLLAPYQVPNSPRVVSEAQSNGIPVLATDLPGLADSVGSGGILVPPAAPVDAWADALAKLWDDPAAYRRYADLAAHHARRDEIDPDSVTSRFEAALVGVVSPLTLSAVADR